MKKLILGILTIAIAFAGALAPVAPVFAQDACEITGNTAHHTITNKKEILFLFYAKTILISCSYNTGISFCRIKYYHKYVTFTLFLDFLILPLTLKKTNNTNKHKPINIIYKYLFLYSFKENFEVC